MMQYGKRAVELIFFAYDLSSSCSLQYKRELLVATVAVDQSFTLIDHRVMAAPAPRLPDSPKQRDVVNPV